MHDNPPATESAHAHAAFPAQRHAQLARASEPQPDNNTRHSPPLSPTERRVYDLLLQRLTERQVAEHIGRSHNTVHVHVRNIYRKLGIRTRQELFDLPYQQAKATRRNP